MTYNYLYLQKETVKPLDHSDPFSKMWVDRDPGVVWHPLGEGLALHVDQRLIIAGRLDNQLPTRRQDAFIFGSCFNTFSVYNGCYIYLLKQNVSEA